MKVVYGMSAATELRPCTKDGCCRLEAQVGTDGGLYVGFRGGFQNIRDPYLLKGKKGENEFKVARISEDKWDSG